MHSPSRVLQQDWASALPDVKHLTTQLTDEKNLLDDVRSNFTFHKTVLEQLCSAHIKDLETLLADKKVVKTKFRMFRADFKPKLMDFRLLLTARWHVLVLFIGSASWYLSLKSLKCQLQLISAGSQEVEDLKYRLDGSVAREHRSQTITGSLQLQWLSLRSNVDKYRQRLLLYTDRFMVDVTDGSSGFLCTLSTEVKKLV